MNKKNNVFLVELMVVISIIGILSAIAVPSYRTYIIKARLTEAISIMGILKPKVLDYYNINGSYPTSITNLGYSAETDINSQYVTQVNLAGPNGYNQNNGGYVRVYINSTSVRGDNSWDNKRLCLGYRETNGVMAFACGNWTTVGNPADSPPTEHLPS